MSNKISLSGSVILSDTSKFEELFLKETTHIEIGEFENENAFHHFLHLLKASDKNFGLHSPLLV
ncbi:hypothetical protein KUV80_16290 [Fictibacillus nanhaiensis]|uniref:hypothetical protein n=1 Tax=Fictibacillus nanhaiensis TaxID=742169 RepID=UPI001C93E1AA|nr:hypothetical protein [Fictibacillus nanhaiensis]MBY6038221.1 hypothetical protein [Fictibacillus nanhaiensis]